jgi:iron complex outermembrane receptor protein
MYRNYFQATDRLTYNNNDDIKAIAFYSDLHYETPGGLTLSQEEADPSEARIATAFTPSAIQAQAAIGTRMWFGGAVNNYHLTDNIRNVLAVYGSYVEFYNPFITNYETRYEGTYGVRTYFELTGQQHKNYNWQAYLGLEWQQTDADINGNTDGMRDTAQTLDKINTDQHFFFGRYSADFFKRLHVEAAISLNYYDYEFKNLYPNDEQGYTNRPFTPQLMPRLALSYQIMDDFAWRASISRGYSTPTTAEIRPTDNVINTSLQAEYGWNYETGFRLKNSDESMFWDASVFYYKLQNAIILHINPDETETYLNSGGTNQPGFELYYTWWIIRQNTSSFIRGLQFNESATIDRFTFSTTHDQLTGVPQQVYISSLQLRLPQQIYIFVEYNYTAKMPLNDANTVFAPYYNLLAAKAGWQHTYRKNSLEIYAGVDNIFNTLYSLGDDLNATGNRYYNPAPLRNYYIGLKVGI